ncbi:MAG TPA: hypothetical protein VJS47_00430 [Rhizomicrobium sp.]|nr:hypothetical protein [Rhizomicrobium sp.]
MSFGRFAFGRSVFGGMGRTPSSGGASYTLAAATGAFNESGIAASLRLGRVLAGAAASYLAGGGAAAFRGSYRLDAGAGAIAFLGSAAVFKGVFLTSQMSAPVVWNFALTHPESWTQQDTSPESWLPQSLAGVSWTLAPSEETDWIEQ